MIQFEFLKGHELVTEESYSSDTSLVHDVIENPILPGTQSINTVPLKPCCLTQARMDNYPGTFLSLVSGLKIFADRWVIFEFLTFFMCSRYKIHKFEEKKGGNLMKNGQFIIR
jgi:hypothetical protein